MVSWLEDLPAVEGAAVTADDAGGVNADGAAASASQALDVAVEIDTPSLVVDLDILEANLREMAELCTASGVELVPHAKTHRTPEIGALQVRLGASGLTVAKLGEAEGFARAGIERLIVAYPLVGAEKVARAAALSQRVDLTLATDSIEGARAIGAHFAERGLRAAVDLIVDSGLGRCGVAPADAADLGSAIAAIPGVELTGVLTHEGTVYAAADRDDLVARSRATAQLMVDAADAIRARGVDLPTVSMGASPSARIARDVRGVTQVRPGIYAFNDLGQIALGNATPSTCAVRVLATVVSHPESGRACIDAGSKSLSQDGLPASAVTDYQGHGLLADLPGWRIEKLSEEHGWLRWHGTGAPTPLAIGQRVQVIPNHVCTVFFSMGESVAIRGGRVEAVWRTLGPGASR